jgi:hypothetical protein
MVGVQKRLLIIFSRVTLWRTAAVTSSVDAFLRQENVFPELATEAQEVTLPTKLCHSGSFRPAVKLGKVAEPPDCIICREDKN